MALNNCFNSPICYFDDRALRKRVASRGFVMGPGLVIDLEYAMRQGSRQLIPDIRSNAGSQEFDRP